MEWGKICNEGMGKMLSTKTRQAYSELDTFLDLLSSEERNMIPQELRNYFRREKDANYIKQITYNEETDSLNLSKDALALIALLNLQYWCQDEEEKKRLIVVYKENGKRVSQNTKGQLKNLNNKEQNAANVENAQSVPCVRETLWSKIISVVKKIFGK